MPRIKSVRGPIAPFYGVTTIRGPTGLFEVLAQRVRAEHAPLTKEELNYYDLPMVEAERGYASQKREGAIVWHRGPRDLSPLNTLRELAELPFYSVNVCAPYDWHWVRLTAEFPEDVPVGVAGFGDGHFDHGWAVAFKGPGHHEIGHRRALAAGPWRLLRDEPNDVTFVQFCDPEADPLVRAKQAEIGRMNMGYGWIPVGLYFSTGTRIYPVGEDHRMLSDGITGVYDPDEHSYTIVRPEGVSPMDLTDLGWLRFTRSEGPDRIERVRVMFYDEALARQQHRTIWARGFETWAVVRGNRVQLDDADLPPPVPPPDWVLRVQDREGY